MAELKFPDWATSDIPDIGNGDPNKADPGPTKQAEGWEVEKPLLQSMNWLQNLQSKYIRANNEVLNKPNGYVMSPGELVIADNVTGPVTLYLPDTPINGQWVEVGLERFYVTFPVTVDGNGKNIMTVGNTSVEMDVERNIIRFVWNEGDNFWRTANMGVVGLSGAE